MKDEIFIDFDGVILDTQKKIDKFFSQYNYTITPEWNEFLINIKWQSEILDDAKEINNSLTILKELYKMKRNIYILSRVFSLEEYHDKSEYLKEKGINFIFIPTPKRIPKSSIITPNTNRLLIDDSSDNIKDWINNNGNGIYFTQDLNDNKYEFKNVTNSLEFLLQKKL